MQPELLDSANVSTPARTSSVTRLIFAYTLIVLTLAVGAIVLVEILDYQDWQQIIDEGGPLYPTAGPDEIRPVNPLAVVLDQRWFPIWIFGCITATAGSLLSRARILDL